jgi:hypothetical protein
MQDFKQVELKENLKDMIKNIFDTDIALSGGWGYSKKDATILYDIVDISKNQFQHNLAHMRVYLEMNILQPKENRYSSISVLEKHREDVENFEIVTYEIKAMLESDYNNFIKEYKENYGKDDFDMSAHFQRRKDATLTREIEYWFDLAKI